MLAVFADGPNQYKVKEGDFVQLDWKKELNSGDIIEFSDVMLITDGTKTTIGQPYINGCKITAEVTESLRKGKKIIVIKFKRRKSYDVKRGHRQKYTIAEIKGIQGVS